MTKQTALYLTKGYDSGFATFANADSTTIKDLYPSSGALAEDAQIRAIAITSTEPSVARDVLLYINDGTGDRPLGHIDIPALSGFDGTVNAVNGMNATNLPWMSKDINGNYYIPLKAGQKLRAAMKTVVTASQSVNVLALAELF